MASNPSASSLHSFTVARTMARTMRYARVTSLARTFAGTKARLEAHGECVQESASSTWPHRALCSE
jgi:hypothetical protein